jgi:hypothetical protein
MDSSIFLGGFTQKLLMQLPLWKELGMMEWGKDENVTFLC